jgi:hypothetical protein
VQTGLEGHRLRLPGEDVRTHGSRQKGSGDIARQAVIW